MPETPDLPFDRSVGFQVRALNRAVQRALGAAIAPHGAAVGTWYFLRVLWERDGLTQRELADAVGMMEPTAAAALRDMEQAGWITRTRDSGDRRKQIVVLTDAGRALRRELLVHAHAVNDRATAGFSDEDRETLLSLLTRARANLDRV
ncbi:MarR family winged helix-turn-helix transcriptional regulator [Roseomonas sp. CCTCC AB2023176]|uniref:MarR family winged helix-turn-helix transcriptional regulator n=1 Tax=Roseomonas sp. CCTCC AB2023176 TaxID=3342640 RepID=UPI0035D9D4E5